MSLVSTYVESREGNWYKLPIIKIKESNWFVCWDDDEPIELVYRIVLEPQWILAYLRKEGWDVDFTSEPEKQGLRSFDGNFHAAGRVFLTQKAGPPDSLLNADALLPERPDCQGVFYYNSNNGWR